MNPSDFETYGVYALIPLLITAIVYLYRRNEASQTARLEDAKQNQTLQNETYAKFGVILDKIYDAVIRKGQ